MKILLTSAKSDSNIAGFFATVNKRIKKEGTKMFLIASEEFVNDIVYKLTNITSSPAPIKHGCEPHELTPLVDSRHFWGLTLDKPKEIHKAALDGMVYGEGKTSDGKIALYVEIDSADMRDRIESAKELYVIKYHY